MKKNLFLILFLTQTSLSWACSCNIGDVSKKFKDHVSIFQGTATEIIFYESTDMHGDQQIKVTFDIEKQWKGKPDQNQLHTVYNEGSCFGYWFKEKESYLVYAFERDGKLNAWWCGGVIQDNADGTGLNMEILELNEILESSKTDNE